MIDRFLSRTRDYVRRVEDQEIKVLKQVKEEKTQYIQIDVETLLIPTISVILSFAHAELDVTGWTKSESGNLTIFYK